MSVKRNFCIGLLHGYSLEGSGSNIWTRYMVQALCREGERLHLVCHEKAPEKYDFIAEAYHYDNDGNATKLFAREIPYPGRCILHRPQLGEVLPVFVGRFLESSPPMLPMNELPDHQVQDYIDRNHRIVREIIQKHGITVLHVNHAILMSVVAQRCHEELSTPYAILPHGSDIEYVIRQNSRFLDLADMALRKAGLIFLLSRELHDRVLSLFSFLPEINNKIVQMNLGVDTTLFEVVPRESRGARIHTLLESLVGTQRRKNPASTEQMLAGLVPDISLAQIKERVNSAQQYASRQPDADLEKKLSQVDWENEQILFYAGRIISGKGIQNLIAALPLILEAWPSARFVIAGSGPLREGMEIFLWALQKSEIELIKKLIEWGSALESNEAKPFTHVRKFYQTLGETGRLDEYFAVASRVVSDDRILFTGYLKHQQLRHLFSSSDVAVFPSIVPEAGPLVFLEALAAGCFPIATDHGGARAHIDLLARHPELADAARFMKIRPEEEFSIADISDHVSNAFRFDGKYGQQLRQIAITNYDWRTIAHQWKQELSRL